MASMDNSHSGRHGGPGTLNWSLPPYTALLNPRRANSRGLACMRLQSSMDISQSDGDGEPVAASCRAGAKSQRFADALMYSADRYALKLCGGTTQPCESAATVAFTMTMRRSCTQRGAATQGISCHTRCSCTHYKPSVSLADSRGNAIPTAILHWPCSLLGWVLASQRAMAAMVHTPTLGLC
eukprot:359853-Chlamydomonas_euryale.AAC.3